MDAPGAGSPKIVGLESPLRLINLAVVAVEREISDKVTGEPGGAIDEFASMLVLGD
jgi:hypothetical protein